MISDELTKLVCNDCCECPQPFLNHEGQWVCKACGLECRLIVASPPKPVEEVKE